MPLPVLTAIGRCPFRHALTPTLLTLALVACSSGSPVMEDAPPDGTERPSTNGSTAGSTGEPALGMALGTPGAPVIEPAAVPATDPADESSTGSASGGASPFEPADPDAVPPDTSPDDSLDGPSDRPPEPAPATSPGSGAASGPVGCDAPPAAIQARALELINAARATERVCGTSRTFAAARTLGWDSRLEDAARRHSADMAATGNFDHTGTDGSSAGDRIRGAGYTWGEYAENIAAGQETVKAAVVSWIDSPGHCRNLMTPGVTDVAVACVTDPDARFRHYWTNVLARPLDNSR